MITAIDTNILLDILIPNTANVQSSLRCLMNEAQDDDLIVCETVYAELGSQFLSSRDLETFIHDTGIKIVSSNETSLYEASRAWKSYLDRRKHGLICPACGKQNKAVCNSCGKIISCRQHILADFLIGAYAQVQTDRFVTRDRGFLPNVFSRSQHPSSVNCSRSQSPATPSFPRSAWEQEGLEL